MPEPLLSHPTDEELRALSLGRLGDEGLVQVATHLDQCAECCRRIDELSAVDPLIDRIRLSASSDDEMLVPPAQRRPAVGVLRRWRSASDGQRIGEGLIGPMILPAVSRVGDYEILAEVGRGGMGVVYRARHRGLQRLAALKMVLAGEFASPAQEIRFRLEAELAARVRHPNIVQVYEVGSDQGRPFLALEWIDGGSLADRLDGRPWTPEAAASLLETLARAIHQAHAEGVVHRDLKPANILLQRERDGTGQSPEDPGRAVGLIDPATGLIPKITDFGLARPIEGGTTLTQSGLLVGTPGYMAPEQAEGRSALVGPATDLYALGVILYQLLTGRLPFEGDSTLETLRAVTSEEPPRPRRLQPRLPRDLEAITLHCLEKEPSRRYPGALALAEDLRRFREGKPVNARPVGAGARLARTCRRRPGVALLIGLLAVSLFGGVAGVTWKWLDADEQRNLADANARRADEETQAALRQAYRARLAAATAALQGHDVADAARQLDAAPAQLRDWEWRHLHSRLDDSASVMPLPPAGRGVLVPGATRLRIGILDGDRLRLSDLDGAGSVTLPIRIRSLQTTTLAETQLGLRIAESVKGVVSVYDQAGRSLGRATLPDDAQPWITVSANGTRLAWVTHEAGRMRLSVADATTGRPIATCEGHQQIVWCCVLSPDGARLASASEDRTAKLWNATTGALIATCRGHENKVVSVAFSPDGRRLLTTSADGTVRQWDAASGEEIEPPYDRHSGIVTTAVYGPDGRWVASAGSDRTVRVWQANGRRDVAVLHGHTGNVTALAFGPDGQRLASLSGSSRLNIAGDDTVRGWDVDSQATLPALRGHTAEVYPVAFSPDGRWIASGSWDRTVRLWDAATGTPCATLPHPDVVHDLAFGPDGTWLASASLADNRLRLWDLATGRLRKDLAMPGGRLRTVTVSPDGRRLAATSTPLQGEGAFLHVCDVETGERVYSSEGRSLAYSPDGRWLAVRAADARTVLLLDSQTHETKAQFRGHEKIVWSATFSPDSRELASCSQDRTVRLWRLDDGSCRVLRGHSDEVFTAAFHPDGTRLASAGRDHAIWLWDLARGEEVAQLRGHTGYVWSLAFSPAGETLASGSGDHTVRLWDTVPLRARYRARREAQALKPEAERLVAGLRQQKHDLPSIA